MEVVLSLLLVVRPSEGVLTRLGTNGRVRRVEIELVKRLSQQ